MFHSTFEFKRKEFKREILTNKISSSYKKCVCITFRSIFRRKHFGKLNLQDNFFLNISLCTSYVHPDVSPVLIHLDLFYFTEIFIKTLLYKIKKRIFRFLIIKREIKVGGSFQVNICRGNVDLEMRFRSGKFFLEKFFFCFQDILLSFSQGFFFLFLPTSFPQSGTREKTEKQATSLIARTSVNLSCNESFGKTFC